MTEQTNAAFKRRVVVIRALLFGEVIAKPNPSPERSMDLLTTLEQESIITNTASCRMTLSILETTKIGYTLQQLIKSLKIRRRASSGEEQILWNSVVAVAEGLLTCYLSAAASEVKRRAHHRTKIAATKSTVHEELLTKPGLPSALLVSQRKKPPEEDDPPAPRKELPENGLPAFSHSPRWVAVDEQCAGALPKRNDATTSELALAT